jgi:hypothetical protein
MKKFISKANKINMKEITWYTDSQNYKKMTRCVINDTPISKGNNDTPISKGNNDLDIFISKGISEDLYDKNNDPEYIEYLNDDPNVKDSYNKNNNSDDIYHKDQGMTDEEIKKIDDDNDDIDGEPDDIYHKAQEMIDE